MSVLPVSLIICTRNRPKLLRDSVKSVLDGEDLPAELIIIDQSDQADSSLSALDSASACQIRYVWHRSVGLSRGRNAGIGLARNSLIAFTDDDVIATRAWFGCLIRALLDAAPRTVVTGRVLPMPDVPPGHFTPSLKEDPTPAVYSGRVGADVLFTFSMAIPASAFSEVGDFDVRLGPGTTFPGAEDNDLCYRLLERGYQIHYVPASVLYHQAWRENRGYVPLRWKYGLGQGAFFAKHFSLRDPYMLGRMWADGWNHISRVFRYGLKRSFRQNYGDIVYCIALMCGAATWLLTQRKTG